MTIVLVQNDKLFDLNITVKNSSGTVIDLTDVTTATFKMKALNSATNKVSRACTISIPALGRCYVTMQPADTDVLGNFKAEIELVYDDGKILTADLDDVFIKEDLPNA